MRMPCTNRTLWLPVLLLGLLAGPVLAVDGVIEINQAKVKAGGVTASDSPLFPVTIDHSGSYRLTSNLDVTDASARPGGTSAENQTAIRVSADYVTIDLNGFSIVGPAVCTGTGPSLSCTSAGLGSGISDATAGGISHVTVLNGSVHGMGLTGIFMPVVDDARIERVQLASNGAAAIALGQRATVTGCSASHNGAAGMVVGEGSAVRDNVVFANKLVGILAGQSCLVAGNVAAYNGEQGLDLGFGSGYVNNSLNFNTLAAVSGGVNLGQNVCSGAVCP